MRRFKRWWFAAGAFIGVMMTVGPARADWVINGEVQAMIPFWYTLKEAVCVYMNGGTGCL